MPVYRDPDEALVVLFKHIAVENEAKSRQEGRPIFDDVEHVEIRSGANKDVKVFPAKEFCGWITDPFTGRQRMWTYAERFKHQYHQFLEHAAQTKTGTPLEKAPFLTEGRRAELRAQSIYTVEQLAFVEGAELKNLGPGGRDMKNLAEAYIAESKQNAPTVQLQAELEALRARNALLEEDFQDKKVREAEEGEFAGMTLEGIREFIKTHTGMPPQGNCNRKTLVRMAQECRPQKVA
jgi:hypothetical protein